MRRFGFLLPAVAFPLAFVLVSFGDSPSGTKPVAFKGARLHTAAGKPIDNGVLVVHQGKIVAVGGPETKLPADAVMVDLAGKTIIPGLVDTHSHIRIWPRPHVTANNDGNAGSRAV